MPVYNVELFTPDISYRDSAQIREVDCEIDYLDVVKNKIDFGKRKIKAEKGDYIRIKSRELEILGIVSDVKSEKNKHTIEYKSFNKLWDLDVYMDFSELEEKSLEAWLAEAIRQLYVDSGDSLQNVYGLTVETTSETNAAFPDYDTGINNLFEIMMDAFTQYGVIVSESMDVGNRKLKITVGKCEAKEFTIEADLDNILEKEIVIKESKESTNKLIVYNEEDYTQQIIYYKNENDEITTDASNRNAPVVLDCVAVKVTEKSTFAEQAEKKANTTLKPTKLNNYIEIKVISNDRLVRPKERKIGQEATVISNGEMYKTVLTGMELDGQIKLIFGGIRIELTKQIKRRWRRNEY